MGTNKFFLSSLSLTLLLLGAVESFEYHEKELETEEGLQAMYARWKDHHKVEEQPPERFNVFKHNVQYVHNVNKEGRSYKLGVNRYATMTKHEFLHTYGDSKIEHYQTLYGSRSKSKLGAYGPFSYENVTEIPDRIDWREYGMVAPVKNQGQCGSCWAFGAVAALESINAIQTGKLVILSEQQLIDCDTDGRNNGCDGGLLCEAYEFCHEHGGLATNESYPYKAVRQPCQTDKFGHHSVMVEGAEYFNGTDENMMKAVAHQPITVAMDCGGDFWLYKEGVFNGPCESTLWHALTVVGYDTSPEGVPYWICRNSWSDEWGDKGYVKLQRGLPGKGACKMNTQPVFPVRNKDKPNCEL